MNRKMGYSNDVVDYTRRATVVGEHVTTIVYGLSPAELREGTKHPVESMRDNYRFDGIYNANERKMDKIEGGLCVQGLIL